ncbi:MAG: flagellar protein FliS [Gammaproteobacteria bacterium]|nr:flagellar protein FliS [Gammaproteobacteria bacterium]
MSAIALKAYRNTAIDARCETSNKRDLVIMMYDAAIDAIKLARQHALRQEKRSVSASTSRALSILAALRETLDRHQGGSVAEHLDDFYQFLMRRLVRAGGLNSTDFPRTIVRRGGEHVGQDPAGPGGRGRPTRGAGRGLRSDARVAGTRPTGGRERQYGARPWRVGDRQGTCRPIHPSTFRAGQARLRSGELRRDSP